MAEFTLWGLGGAAVTALLVQAIKAVTGEAIKDRWAVLVSVLVGLVLSGVAYAAEAYPLATTIINVVGAGLLAGLAACGLFSVTKTRS